MKFDARDGVALAVVATLIGVLAFGTGKGKGRAIPLDDRHRPSYDALKKGREKSEVELLCTTCHSKSSIPLPSGHPPKEQCLSCHPLRSS